MVGLREVSRTQEGDMRTQTIYIEKVLNIQNGWALSWAVFMAVISVLTLQIQTLSKLKRKMVTTTILPSSNKWTIIRSSISLISASYGTSEALSKIATPMVRFNQSEWERQSCLIARKWILSSIKDPLREKEQNTIFFVT